MIFQKIPKKEKLASNIVIFRIIDEAKRPLPDPIVSE